MLPALLTGLIALLVLAALAASGWYVWRAWLQLCPHCGWVVRRVQRGWLRCPRCHRQYARAPKLKTH